MLCCLLAYLIDPENLDFKFLHALHYLGVNVIVLATALLEQASAHVVLLAQSGYRHTRPCLLQ